ncbi:MAG: TIGR02186 family protein [Pseudomonadota bacterium]
MIARWAILLALLVVGGAARSETLVADLSTDTISVNSEFGGMDIALFGVIQRDDQTVARSGRYDVAVVVKGPGQDVLVQKKARRAGIWINAEGVRFQDIPSYLGVFTTPASPQEITEWLRSAERSKGEDLTLYTGREGQFYEAFSAQQREEGLYLNEIGAVEMLTDRFFRTVIPLPGDAEHGRYDVEVLLFVEGVLLNTHQLEFVVAKVGVEQSVFSFSRTQPLLYGLSVVVLALVTGYVGGVVFRRS